MELHKFFQDLILTCGQIILESVKYDIKVIMRGSMFQKLTERLLILG